MHIVIEMTLNYILCIFCEMRSSSRQFKNRCYKRVLGQTGKVGRLLYRELGQRFDCTGECYEKKA